MFRAAPGLVELHVPVPRGCEEALLAELGVATLLGALRTVTLEGTVLPRADVERLVAPGALAVLRLKGFTDGWIRDVVARGAVRAVPARWSKAAAVTTPAATRGSVRLVEPKMPLCTWWNPGTTFDEWSWQGLEQAELRVE